MIYDDIEDFCAAVVETILVLAGVALLASIILVIWHSGDIMRCESLGGEYELFSNVCYKDGEEV